MSRPPPDDPYSPPKSIPLTLAAVHRQQLEPGTIPKRGATPMQKLSDRAFNATVAKALDNAFRAAEHVEAHRGDVWIEAALVDLLLETGSDAPPMIEFTIRDYRGNAVCEVFRMPASASWRTMEDAIGKMVHNRQIPAMVS